MARIELRMLASKAVSVPLRTAHLAAMAVLVGGRALAPAHASLGTWQLLTAATGAALLVTEASHSRHWAYQGRGLMALAHVALAGLAGAALLGGSGLTMAALLVGALGSHLPRTVRWWSLRHRRVLVE
jgi:hypothetical protein